MKDQMPSEKYDRIINAHLKSGAIEISATDWLDPTKAPKQGNTVGIYVVGGKYSELKSSFR
jgi:PhnB protein